MKAVLSLGLLAAMCFVGCASSKKQAVTVSFTKPTTTTLADAKVGDTIRCGSFGAVVPALGQGVGANADGPVSSGSLRLAWKNGSLQVSCELDQLQTAERPTAAGNRRKAELAATRLIDRFVPPRGAMRLQREPSGDRGFLRHGTFAIGGQSVNEYAFWKVPRGLDSVVAFVESHPPRGSVRPGGYGTSRGAGIPANKSLDFVIQDARGHRPQRWMEVTMVALSNGSTGIRVDVSAGWLVPRPQSETVPAAVREIDIHGRQLARRVTKPAKVQTIIRWFDALNIVQRGIAYHCPALIGRYRVVFAFRSAQHVLLARALLNSAGPSTDCNPIEFSIRRRTQTPLVGLTFWSRVRRLVGITTR